MSGVLVGSREAYSKHGVGTNWLVGDPTERVKFSTSDGKVTSVAYQVLKAQPADGQVPSLGLWGLFYYAQKVDFLDGEGPVWILINKNSAIKNLDSKAIKSHGLATALLLSNKGAKDDEAASESIFSSIQEVTGLSHEEIFNILQYVRINKQEHIKQIPEGREFVSIRPAQSGLARQILFFRDGRVIIKFNRLRRGDKKLGKGSFSTVKTAYEINEGKLLAVSTTRKGLKTTEAGYREGIKSTDSHIVKVHGMGIQTSDKSGEKLTILMDLHEGDLQSFLDKPDYSIAQRRQNGLDLLKAFEELHARDKIYQDGKPENCLITKEGRLVLGDLGAVVSKDTSEKGRFLGTQDYMSPQVCSRKRGSYPTPKIVFDQKNDVWSAGLILYKLMKEDVKPYFKSDLFDEIKDGNARSGNDAWMLKDGVTINSLSEQAYQGSSSAQMAFLIADMLHPEAEKRPTVAQARERYERIFPTRDT